MFCGDKQCKIEQFMFCESKQCKVKGNLEYWVLVPENFWGQVGRSLPGGSERAMLEAVKILPSYQERNQDIEIFRSTRHHWGGVHTELTRHDGGLFCFMWQIWKTSLLKHFGAQMIPVWDKILDMKLHNIPCGLQSSYGIIIPFRVPTILTSYENFIPSMCIRKR